jgi:hypothetical protein
MHPYLITAAGHAAHGHLAAQAGPVIAALVIAAVLVAVLKGIAWVLSPRKRKDSRQSSPYAAPARRR